MPIRTRRPRAARGKRPQHLHVALGVVERRGRLLICRRLDGDAFGGYWEFPGGKKEAAESWEGCLRRELREELGISISRIRPYGQLRSRYQRRPVLFRIFRCRLARGRPRPLQAEALRWVSARELAFYRFPPANDPLLKRLVSH